MTEEMIIFRMKKRSAAWLMKDYERAKMTNDYDAFFGSAYVKRFYSDLSKILESHNGDMNHDRQPDVK